MQRSTGAARLLALFCALALLLVGPARGTAQTRQTPSESNRVVLITLDGARTQEIFGGLDIDVLQSTLKPEQRIEDDPTYKRFWAETREERRRKLMPFFWGTLMAAAGSIAGDEQAGSAVRLTNQHRFSYPGYAEILLGEAHDEEIKSNDPIRNPYVTVLDTIRDRLGLPRERVATFASWGVFNAIAEHTEGSTIVNAGLEDIAYGDAGVRALAAAQTEALTPWANTRFDYFTFKFAMAHLAAARPRVLYLAFDETDDWAHGGRYDRLLDAYARIDRYLEQLWKWLQAEPDYRGRTHLLITTDHGRGRTPADWRDHGAKIAGAEQVWIAFASPAMSARGPWTNHGPIYSSQIAATIARWMGIDWRALHPAAGAPIEQP